MKGVAEHREPHCVKLDLPVIVVTNTGNRTGAIRKTPSDACKGWGQLYSGGLPWRCS